MSSIRAAAIIINNEQIVLLHRKKDGKEYYVFPGGSVEFNETTEQAVVREVLEETSLQVKVSKLLYQHEYMSGSQQYYYLCSYTSGEPALGESEEKERMIATGDLYEPMWVAIDQIPEMLIYPLEIRDWLVTDIANKFADVPRVATLDTSKLRL